MLGWHPCRPASTACERDFYVRQLWDSKGSALTSRLMKPKVDDCLREGLRRRARASPCPLRRRDRDRELPRQRAIASTGRSPTFAEAYADQNERDYEALKAAVTSGRVKAEMGV